MVDQCSDIQKTIRQYVMRSAETCNQLTDHTLTCFVGMIETGEAVKADFDAVHDGLGAVVLEWKDKLDAERVVEQ